jgi:hypothetical protein
MKKGKSAVQGEGSNRENTKSINTEKTPNKTIGRGGLPHTFYGNSRTIDTDHSRKKK